MKKNLILLSIILLSVSCKKEKETKTITKIDPSTGKTISVEVPVEKEEKTEESLAIKDSLGVYKQSFKLEIGKTYPLTTYQREVKTMTDPKGNTLNGTSESTDEMSFKVNDFKDNIYQITINLVSKRNSQSSQGKTIIVDTKLPMPKEDQLKMIWSVNKALTNNKLEMKMSSKGEVLSITGFDAIYAKVNAEVGKIVKDSKQKSAIMAGMKQSFNDKILKEQFVKNLLILPKKGAKIGEKWADVEDTTGKGDMKLSTTYTLKKAENGIVEISIHGGIPKKTEKKTEGKLTHSLSSELAQSGTILFDQKTGWIANQNVKVTTTQIETISDGKQSESMKSVSNSSVMINPK